MTPAEVAAVLGLIATFDGRKVEREHAAAWHAMIGHLDLDTAADAVKAHYAGDSPEWLMPAHILNFDRRRRAEAADRAKSEAIAASVVDVDEVARRVYRGEPFALPPPVQPGQPPDAIRQVRQARNLVLSVPCPYPPCSARIGEGCTTLDSRKADKVVRRAPLRGRIGHPSREEAAGYAAPPTPRPPVPERRDDPPPSDTPPPRA